MHDKCVNSKYYRLSWMDRLFRVQFCPTRNYGARKVNVGRLAVLNGGQAQQDYR